jgi:hypothetical protein
MLPFRSHKHTFRVTPELPKYWPRSDARSLQEYLMSTAKLIWRPLRAIPRIFLFGKFGPGSRALTEQSANLGPFTESTYNLLPKNLIESHAIYH